MVESALLGSGRWVMSRSFKYHRPHGPLTMAGQDADTLVQIGSEPNAPADRDLNSALDRFGGFMPVGFYYRSFFGPRKADWLCYWGPLIRKSAGLGRIATALPPADCRKQNLHCDVLVVGAGPAAMAAARTAAQAGVEVVLVDSEPETGGALTQGRHAGDLLQRQREALRVLLGATCNGWFTDNFIPVLQGDLLSRIGPRRWSSRRARRTNPWSFATTTCPTS
ncbi:FAD-dependent oxidoreductase [Paracoccus sp. MC1854]|uniref:FAD-dependent oxidoreductase n=1 Tax=Paracoccus sp. MC1854 TaxID=2760306 RepID=UPI00160183F9|nr:FAD-dependent oxidoreductase [Paracoccus sp. MC1854]MBB1490690.1 FAD-dependent oxidoreductase [Paracoccus sp. MC1854]